MAETIDFRVTQVVENVQTKDAVKMVRTMLDDETSSFISEDKRDLLEKFILSISENDKAKN